MPQSTRPNGCLAFILDLFGIRLGGPVDKQDFPYRQRDDFLSPAEFSFYGVLLAALGNQAVICPKVGLGDIFYVPGPNDRQSFRNKIDRKHVDFLLCDPQTMKPRLGIELDDASHRRADRVERDSFVESVFRSAGLPLARFPVRSSYDPKALVAQLVPHLEGAASDLAVPPPIQSGDSPICSKCGVAMVQRVASKGPNKGKPFWGCPNFPQCRETA